MGTGHALPTLKDHIWALCESCSPFLVMLSCAGQKLHAGMQGPHTCRHVLTPFCDQLASRTCSCSSDPSVNSGTAT